MKTRLVCFLLIFCGLPFVTPAAHAQQPAPPPLPADLLFTASLTAGQGDHPRNIIVRVDAQTLEVTPFYVDTEADEIIPIGWSPQGDFLAIYRILPAIDEAYTLFPRELCILDRAGVLQRCLEDRPPMIFVRGPYYWVQYYPIVWGNDGQTIFFDTEYVNESSPYGYGKRLIEASVSTGENLRVVYEYPDPFSISLSPDLTQAVVGFGGPWIGPEAPAYWVNLTSGVQIDIPSLAPNLTTLSTACVPVSPKGNYITATADYEMATYAPYLDPTVFYGYGNLLIIIDRQGVILDMIGQPTSDIIGLECPGWQADEQAFIFLACGLEQNYLMRYSLPDHQLTTLYEVKDWPEKESNVYSPLIPSPEGTHIALTVSDDPYGDRLVAVLYPDGVIRRIQNPYRFSLYPLWIPPLTD